MGSYQLQDDEGNVQTIETGLSDDELESLFESSLPRNSEIENPQPVGNQAQAYIPQGLQAIGQALHLQNLASQGAEAGTWSGQQMRTEYPQEAQQAVAEALRLQGLASQGGEAGVEAARLMREEEEWKRKSMMSPESMTDITSFPNIDRPPQEVANAWDVAKGAVVGGGLALTGQPGAEEAFNLLAGQRERPPTELEQGVAAAQNIGAGIAKIPFDPMVAAGIGVSMAVPALAPWIAGGFAGHMLSGLPQQYETALTAKTPYEKYKAYGDIGLTLGFSAPLTWGFVRGGFSPRSIQNYDDAIRKTTRAVQELLPGGGELKAERLEAQKWLTDRAAIQKEIDTLQAGPESPFKALRLRQLQQQQNMGTVPPAYARILSERAKEAGVPYQVVWDDPDRKVGQYAGVGTDADGKPFVKLYGEELPGYIERLSRRQRGKAIERTFDEEIVHKYTKGEDADEAYDTAGKVERATTEENYGYRAGEHGVTTRDIGYEIIRQRIQRLSGKGTREAAEAGPLERINIRAAEVYSDVVSALGREVRKRRKLPEPVIDEIVRRTQRNIRAASEGFEPVGAAARTITRDKVQDDVFLFSKSNKVPDNFEEIVIGSIVKQPVPPEAQPLVDKFMAEHPEYQPMPVAPRKRAGRPRAISEVTQQVKEWGKEGQPLTEEQKKWATDELEGKVRTKPPEPPAARVKTYQEWKDRTEDVPLSFQEWRDVMDDISRWQGRLRPDRSVHEKDMLDQLTQDHAQLIKQHPEWLKAETRIMQEGGEKPGISAGTGPAARMPREGDPPKDWIPYWNDKIKGIEDLLKTESGKEFPDEEHITAYEDVLGTYKFLLSSAIEESFGRDHPINPEDLKAPPELENPSARVRKRELPPGVEVTVFKEPGEPRQEGGDFMQHETLLDEYERMQHEWYDQLNWQQRRIVDESEKRGRYDIQEYPTEPNEGSARSHMMGNGFDDATIDEAIKYLNLKQQSEATGPETGKPGYMWDWVTSKGREFVQKHGYFELAVHLPKDPTSRITRGTDLLGEPIYDDKHPYTGARYFAAQHEPFPNDTVVHGRGWYANGEEMAFWNPDLKGKIKPTDKVLVVEEAQSDWLNYVKNTGGLEYNPQTRGANHPLLQHTDQILMQAMLKEAAQNKADWIAVVDSGTSMMTQRLVRLQHGLRSWSDSYEEAAYWRDMVKKEFPNVDVKVRKGIPSEGEDPSKYSTIVELGKESQLSHAQIARLRNQFHMRLEREAGHIQAYDKTLPAVLEGLTDSKPIKVSFGPHEDTTQGAVIMGTYEGQPHGNAAGMMFKIEPRDNPAARSRTQAEVEEMQLEGWELLGNYNSEIEAGNAALKETRIAGRKDAFLGKPRVQTVIFNTDENKYQAFTMERPAKEVADEISREVIYRSEGETQSFPAALSKRAKELAKLREMQALQAAGQEPPKMKGEGPQKMGQFRVPPEERTSAEAAGALPRISGIELEKAAAEHLAAPITGKLGKAKEVQGGFTPGNIRFNRPSFKEFAGWARRNMGAKAAQVREIWEDKVWDEVLKAPDERIEAWRHALDLEKKVGNRPISPAEAPTSLEEMAHFGREYALNQIKRMEKKADELEAQAIHEPGAQTGELFGTIGGAKSKAVDLRQKAHQLSLLLRRASVQGLPKRESGKKETIRDRNQRIASQRYRNKVVSAIAQRLIEESIQDRPSLTRDSVSIDDINFNTGKAAYTELRKEDVANPDILMNALRGGGHGSLDPETATHRLVAVVDTDGRVHLLGTYNDAGVQRIVDPTGTAIRNKAHRILNPAFIKRYRPFATMLIEDPVKNFRQNFASVSEFMDKIGEQAAERSKVGEWPGEGPSVGFEAEGTAGLEGEGGGVTGPMADVVRATMGMARGTMESRAPVTGPEMQGILSHITDEVGEFREVEDVRESLIALTARAAGRLTPADRLALSGYAKIFRELERLNPDEARDNLVDRMARILYEAYEKSDPTKPETFVARAMAQIAPSGPEAAGPGQPVRPPTGREVSIPTARRGYGPASGLYGGSVARRAADIARKQAEAARGSQRPARLTPEEQAYIKGRAWAPANPEIRGGAPQVSGEAMEPVPEYGQKRMLERGRERREVVAEAEGENYADYRNAVANDKFKGSYREWRKEHHYPGGPAAMNKDYEVWKETRDILDRMDGDLYESNAKLYGRNPDKWPKRIREEYERGKEEVGKLDAAYPKFVEIMNRLSAPPGEKGEGSIDVGPGLGPQARIRRQDILPTMSKMIRNPGSGYDEWMADRLARVGGDQANQAASLFKGIIDRAKELYGELTPVLDPAKKLAGANRPLNVPGINRQLDIPSISGSRAASWLNRLDKTTPYAGTRKVVEAMEGEPKWSEATKMWSAKRERYTLPSGVRRSVYRIIRNPVTLPPHVEKVMGPARLANLEIGKMAEPVTSHRFRATGLFQRNLTSEGYDFIREGRGPAWYRWTEGLAIANKMDVGQVREFFREWKEELDRPGVDIASIERMNQDFTRKYPKVITDVKVNGTWHPVVHANLFNYLENAAQRASHIRAFREMFPNTRDGRKAIAEMREGVAVELGAKYQKDFEAVLRTMQGHPTDSYADWGALSPSSTPGHLFRMFNQTVGNLMAKMVLTGQMIVQPGETLTGATPVFLGYPNYARAAGRYLKDLASGGQLYAQIEQQGMINQAMYDFSFDPHSPIRSTFKMAGNTISKVFMEQFLNELQEKLAATTAQVVTERIKAGTITDWEKRMLPQTFKSMGFGPEEIQTMMQDQAGLAQQFAPDEVAELVKNQDQLLGQFQRKASAFLTSGNKAIAESSRLGANRLFNSIMRFQTYPMMKTQQFRKVMGNAVEAFDTGDATQKWAASAQLARFLFGSTMQGALTVALTSWLYEGTQGPVIRTNEAEDDPLTFLSDSFFASIGGPLYMVVRGARYKGIKGVGEQLVRSVFPYAGATELMDMAQGEGKYKDQSMFDRIGKFIETKAPGTKAISSALALVGLGQEDRELEASIKAFRRWSLENLGYQYEDVHLEQDTRKEFRTAMQKVVKAVRSGDHRAFNQSWMEAVGATMTMRGKKQPGDRISESLSQRKLLRTPDGQELTPEQLQALQKHIGFRAYDKLRWYDLMLEEAGKGKLMPRLP